MAFNNYLEDENDKPYFTTNSLAYYYDKMEGFAEKVEGSAKALNLTKEEVEKRLTLYIEQNKNELDQRHAQNKNELDQRLEQWDGKLETFDSSVETLLSEWVDDGTLSHVIDSTLIDQRISPIAQKIDFGLPSLPFGEIKIPSDFAKVPFNLFRGRDGIIKHDYDLKKYDVGELTIYVNVNAANDSKDGLTEENAVRSITKGLELALARPETNIVIKVIEGGFFIRDRSPTIEQVITNKRITISTLDHTKMFWSGVADVLTWTKASETTNVYQTSRSNASGILDKRTINLDYNGIPKPYKMVGSVAECDSTEGSWFLDGTTLYTHAVGHSQPDNVDVFGLVKVENWKFKLVNSTLVIKNMFNYNGGSYDGFNISGDINSTFILDNVKLFHSNPFNLYSTGVGNGVVSSDIGLTLLFGVTSAYGNRDGFNYHYTGIPLTDRRKCLVVEYNCMAYDYGINDLENTNDNATTMHEGACILRIGTIGYRTRGPVLADVNASYSINYDTHMRDSLASPTANSGKNKVAMKFHTGGATIAEIGKTILVNCSGGGDVNWGLYREGDVDTEFIIQGFKGANMASINNVKVVK